MSGDPKQKARTIPVASLRERDALAQAVARAAQVALGQPVGPCCASDQTQDDELLQVLLETVSDAIYFKDRESRFLRVSHSLARKDGLADPSQLIGKTDFDRFTLEHARPAFEDEQRILATGEPVLDKEEKETWADGRITWVSTSKYPFRNRTGEVIGTFGISRDITMRKQAELRNQELERQLNLAHKLESLGRLSAGIAHEINTPTQFISDNTRFVRSSLTDVFAVLDHYRRLVDQLAAVPPEFAATRSELAELAARCELDYLQQEIPAALDQSMEGLSSITRIVRSLKEVSHPNSHTPVPADLHRIIGTAITISRHEWKYVATVETDFDPALTAVPCIVDEFHQVMLNLIVNAAQAIAATASAAEGELGRITIRTRTLARHALVEVADTGIGIPESARVNIFEPFFTTKEVGKGTGQGLAIVRNIVVKHHGGEIDFTSDVGQGTTFQIRLPLTASSPSI